MAEVNSSSSQYHENLNDVLDGMQADLDNLRTAITTLTAKLDTDGGVTDTDYASTCDPDALNTTTD